MQKKRYSLPYVMPLSDMMDSLCTEIEAFKMWRVVAVNLNRCRQDFVECGCDLPCSSHLNSSPTTTPMQACVVHRGRDL